MNTCWPVRRHIQRDEQWTRLVKNEYHYLKILKNVLPTIDSTFTPTCTNAKLSTELFQHFLQVNAFGIIRSYLTNIWRKLVKRHEKYCPAVSFVAFGIYNNQQIQLNKMLFSAIILCLKNGKFQLFSVFKDTYLAIHNNKVMKFA